MENGHGNERPPSYDESQLRKILAMMQAMTDAMSMFTKETANTPTRASVATQPNAKAKRSIANNFATKGKQLYQAIQALVKSRHGPKSPENAINEFATRFRQLAKDMKYVADLAEDPAITAACGFDQSNSLKTRMRYCVDQIEYLEDNGLFPPVDSMNDSEQRRKRIKARTSFVHKELPRGARTLLFLQQHAMSFQWRHSITKNRNPPIYHHSAPSGYALLLILFSLGKILSEHM